jgi:hypothetical protein
MQLESAAGFHSTRLLLISQRVRKIEAFANPRVGLLGNPSDLFDGAAAKFCGSGGSIVGAPGPRTDWRSLSASFEREGFRFLQPKISGHANVREKDDSPAGC